MYSAIFFDLDGTLADSVSGIEWAAHKALGEALPDAPLLPLRKLIGPPIEIIFHKYLEEFAPAIFAQMNETKCDNLVAAYRKFYDSEGCARCDAFAGAKAVLRHLQDSGVRNFVVTNKPKIPAGKVLRALELDTFFEATIMPDSRNPIYESKTEMVRVLLEEHALPADGVLLVGDAMDDARAAHHNGIDFAAVTHGYGAAHLQSEFPIRHTIDDLSSLLEITRAAGVLAP
jgi:phosphoglycolate phosphatase-like HAD superfamily hydrolase